MNIIAGTYKTLTAAAPEELDIKVNQALNDGYCLAGHAYADSGIFCQVIAKYASTKEKILEKDEEKKEANRQRNTETVEAYNQILAASGKVSVIDLARSLEVTERTAQNRAKYAGLVVSNLNNS